MPCAGSVSDSDIVQLGLQLSDCATLSNLVLTSYCAFYRDSEWFIRRSLGVVFMAEVQNVVAAGLPNQILALCEVRSAHRALIMTDDNDLAHADSHKMLSSPATWATTTGCNHLCQTTVT